jgi:hypothetical protein
MEKMKIFQFFQPNPQNTHKHETTRSASYLVDWYFGTNSGLRFFAKF